MTCMSTEEQLPISRPSLLPSPLLLKPPPAIPLLHVLSDPVQIPMSTNIALIKKVGRAYKKAQEELQPYVTPTPQYGQHVFDHYPQTVTTAVAHAPAGTPPVYQQADWGPAPPLGSYPPPHPGYPPPFPPPHAGHPPPFPPPHAGHPPPFPPPHAGHPPPFPPPHAGYPPPFPPPFAGYPPPYPGSTPPYTPRPSNGTGDVEMAYPPAAAVTTAGTAETTPCGVSSYRIAAEKEQPAPETAPAPVQGTSTPTQDQTPQVATGVHMV
jgi:Wiskott-Aldrich syndrome protein